MRVAAAEHQGSSSWASGLWQFLETHPVSPEDKICPLTLLLGDKCS
jgi:hypothetical protein